MSNAWNLNVRAVLKFLKTLKRRMESSHDLRVGDRLRLSGGYDPEPAWLVGVDYHLGTLIAFVPGQNTTPAALVELDAPLNVKGVEGRYLVMELRYVGAEWTAHETVHIELCDFYPEPLPWKDRRQGKWIESHASYSRL